MIRGDLEANRLPRSEVWLLAFLLALAPLHQSPADQTDHLITASSAGKIRHGMTVSEARTAMKSATFKRTGDGEGLALIGVSQGGVQLMTLYAGEEDAAAAINEKATIEFIEVWSPTYKTAAGVHCGMKLSEAENKMGKVQEIMMSEIESREFVTFAAETPGLQCRLSGGGETAGDYANGQSTTSRYTPGTTILSIAVSGKPKGGSEGEG